MQARHSVAMLRIAMYVILSAGPNRRRSQIDPKSDRQALEMRTFNVPVQRRRGSAVRCNRLLGVFAPLAPEYNMGGFLRRN